MIVEKNWNGEDLLVTLSQEEASTLASFLEFFSREKVGAVTNEEYDVAQKLYNEITSYIDDELEAELAVERFNKLFKQG